MRAVIQRVNYAKVVIENKIYSEIGKGVLVLLGVAPEDTEKDIEWLANKIVNLRIFPDSEGKMNKSVKDVEGEIMIVSQFTLFASTKKGTRPSYSRAAKPEKAIPMYEKFKQKVREILGKEVKSGEFGAYMKIELENDGPVTIYIDSQSKE